MNTYLLFYLGLILGFVAGIPVTLICVNRRMEIYNKALRESMERLVRCEEARMKDLRDIMDAFYSSEEEQKEKGGTDVDKLS